MNIGIVVRNEALFGEFNAKVVISPILIGTAIYILKYALQYTIRFKAKCIPYGRYERKYFGDKKLFALQRGLDEDR
jgi:hypothetical protein